MIHRAALRGAPAWDKVVAADRYSRGTAIERIDHKRAGLLRRMPGHGEDPIRIDPVLKPAWRALGRIGLACVGEGTCRRTAAGDAALAAFDAALAVEEVAMLRRVRDDPRSVTGDWSLHRLVAAGLVSMGVRSNGVPSITPAGLGALEGR